jgi:quercetin dioxygenase-like cupin family protein
VNYNSGPITHPPSSKQFGGSFEQEGFLGPISVLSPEACSTLATYLRKSLKPPPADWSKGRAVTDRIIYELSIHPRLLDVLSPLLGPNFVLWGASVVKRAPGQAHPWHTDIESSSPEGGFVSVWIGVENTSRDSALQIISRSHSMKPIQQVMRERRWPRAKSSSEEFLGWVRESDPDAALIIPDIHDGEAIIFDGRIWHGSLNSREAGQRTAVLLQYACTERPVRIPDLQRLNWPFRLFDVPRPPVIVVRGTPSSKVNRIVPPPPPLGRSDLPLVSTIIRRPKLPLAEDRDKLWKPHPQFDGVSGIVDRMTCHISVLSAGHTPHPPHNHCEEELLMVLDGEAEIIITDDPEAENAKRERLVRGDFVYYPGFQHHTIHNSGADPVTYVMFKWRGSPSSVGEQLPTSIVRNASRSATSGEVPVAMQRVLEGSTAYLGKLHAHTTVMQPGAGYKPHSDPYDVAIVVLAGQVKTLGASVGANGIIYYAGGEAHGMENRASVPAHYAVFEFHRT